MDASSGPPLAGCAEGGASASTAVDSSLAGRATAGEPGTSGGETVFPAPVGSELVGNTAKMPGKKNGPVAERRQRIEGQLAGGPS